MRDLASRSFTGTRARAPVGLDLDGVTPPVRRRRFVRRSERYRARLALRDGSSDEESGSEDGDKRKDKQRNGGGGGGNKKNAGSDGHSTEDGNHSTDDDSHSSDDDGDKDPPRSSTARPAPKPTTAPAPLPPPVPPGPPDNPGIPESGGAEAGPPGGERPAGAGQVSNDPPRNAPAQTPAETSTVVTSKDGTSDAPAQTDAPAETQTSSASEMSTFITSVKDASSSSPTPLTTTSDPSPTGTDEASVQDTSSSAVPMSKPPPSNAQETAPPSVDGKKPFPLPAAAVIGAVLSFLVVSGIVWGLWFWLRRRRRARALPPDWDFAPPPKRMSGLSDSTYTVSTDVPHFISAAEAREQSRNPFAHPADERERDPFGGPAKLRRGNTLGTVSTMSV